MQLDEVEQFATDITEKEGMNISAEGVSGGYAILIGPVGKPRQHYKTLSRERAMAFLEGVTAGITMLQAEIARDMAGDAILPEEEIDYSEYDELPEHILAAAAEAARCPDCLSTTTEPVKTPRGTWYMEVRHDPSCPTMNKWIKENPQEE